MAQRASKSGKRVTPAVGDEVRVPADVRNEFVGYEHSRGLEGTREPVDGIIISIREIASGQRVKVAAGDPRGYVFDLLDDRTFDPRVSSKSNTQGVTGGRVYDSPAFGQIQRALREHADRTVAAGADALLGQEPLSAILDGWRLVRVCAARVEVKETRQEG